MAIVMAKSGKIPLLRDEDDPSESYLKKAATVCKHGPELVPAVMAKLKSL
jgi:hypothetical protein